MYSEKVLLALESSGWKPDRRVLVDVWTARLMSEGFTILPEALSLLEVFGGLVIRPVKSRSDVYVANAVTFDPVLAASGEFDRVDYWQKKLNLTFTPIAEVGGAILMLASDGRLFSCRDRIIWLEGESFDDAIENTLVVPTRRPVEFARMQGT
jgi:hypothetical protein